MDEPHYEPIFFTGRRRLRDASLMLTGTGRRPLRDKLPYEPEAEAYGTEALGRASLWAGGGGAYGTSLLTGRSADYGKRLRDELLRDDVPSLRDGGGGGGLRDTGRASLRDASLRTGGAYGTSLLRASLRDEPPCAEALTDEPPYETEALLYGPEALTGRLLTGGSAYGTSPKYGPETLTGRASLRAGGGGLRDEPPYGTEALGRASLRAGALLPDS
eukprot:s155_g25.t1